MKKLSLIVLFLFAGYAALAQFTINAELRPRFELRDGYRTLKLDDSDPGVLFTQRTVLGMTYKTDLYTTRVSFHDIRTWGSEALKTNEVSAALREAWVEFNVDKGFKIKTGRQILSYDNQRLIGTMNWNQVGAQHDAIKLAFEKNKFEMEVVAAYNQTAEDKDVFEVPYELYNKHYKNLGIIWLKHGFKNFSIATLNIFEGLRENNVDDEMNGRFTNGLIFKYNKNKFAAELRGFHQSGEKGNGTSVNAQYLNAILFFKANKSNTLRAEFDYYTGNDEAGVIGDEDKAFDVIYGGRHIFNGKMDYFLKPTSTLGLGLINYRLGWVSKLSSKVNLMIDYHYFRTQGDFMKGTQEYEAYLGSEIDIEMKWKISKEVILSAMYGLMLPSDSMAAVKNVNSDANTSHYFMTMLVFKPTFFKN